MGSEQLYESLVHEIFGLDRATMIERLTHFDGDLALDFSEEFLNGCDTDRIRHLLMAAVWRCRMKERMGMAEAQR